MKKLFFSFLLSLSLTLSLVGQISFVQSVNYTQLSTFYMNDLTLKFTTQSNSSIQPSQLTDIDTVIIFNSDFSIRRQVILPPGYSSCGLFSDKLFNNDTLIEFVTSKYLLGTPYYYPTTTSIINELGNIIYTFPDTLQNGVGIFNNGNDFYCTYQTFQNITRVYSVPGTLPCNQCNYTTGITEPTQGGGLSGLNVYPNPFNNSLEINYNFLSKQDNPRILITDILGRELKSIPLVNQSDRINLNTSDLPKGTIIVSLIGSGQNVISKKVIKID